MKRLDVQFLFLKTKRGFVLLLAVLVASILVALGTAIFDLVSKTIILSSSGRESQFAFYAADSGVECALYWDKAPNNAFASTSPDGSLNPLTAITCGSDPGPVTLTRIYDPTAKETTTTFEFHFDGSLTKQCAAVQVVKHELLHSTTLDSRGHNTCDTSNPLRLERGIRVTY